MNEVEGVIDLNKIFTDLKGNDKEYDLRIFDLFAEIRSVVWASNNGFVNIQKVPRTTYRTPDFIMSDGSGNKVIMEVKHIRSGNPFHNLANDRAKGLLLVNGLIDQIGLKIDETDKYLRYQHKILAIRNIYNVPARKLRKQLSSDR
ncbi:hypothetical protein ACFLUS_01610, partial [Chloroflexota bacterium]